MADATEASIQAARSTGALEDADAGALAALRRIARQIDAQSNTGLTPDGKLDNVSIPTYLKYCDALGLTPAGRLKLGEKKEGPGGKLAQLRAVHGGNRGA